jgi:hypothetical protein
MGGMGGVMTGVVRVGVALLREVEARGFLERSVPHLVPQDRGADELLRDQSRLRPTRASPRQQAGRGMQGRGQPGVACSSKQGASERGHSAYGCSPVSTAQ